MSYLSKHEDYVEEQTKAFKTLTLASLRNVLLDNLEDYDKEYSAYAKDADAWNGRNDRIQIFLSGITVHKSMDFAQSKNEIYVTTIFADDGRLQEPQTFVMPSYQVIKKGETFVFTNPVRVYEGNPKGAIDYALMAFETKTLNHDNSVDAATAIIKKVGNVAAAALTVAVGPVAGVIGKLVTDAASAVASVAKEHKDELAGQFLGTLTEHDHSGVGPYSLAKPEISLENSNVELNLLVVRVPGERRQQAGKGRPKRGRPTRGTATQGVILSREMRNTRFSASRHANAAELGDD